MEKFLFFNIVITMLNIFLIVYTYSLNFFPKKWRNKVNQDTLEINNLNISADFLLNIECVLIKE